MNTNKTGKIWSYSETKFVGTILEDGNSKRWFFHRGRITKGGAEVIDARVKFIADDDEKPKAGLLPSAYQIEILDPSADVPGGKSTEVSRG